MLRRSRIAPHATVDRTATRHPRRRRLLAALSSATLPVVALVAQSVRAGSQTYVGPSGDWSDSSKWSGGATPNVGDDAQIVQAALNNLTVTFDVGAVATNLASLVTDRTGTGNASIALTQSANLLSTTTEYVGIVGSGILNLNGGTHSITGAGSNALFVALNTGSVGTVNVAGATLTVADSTYVGVGGFGTFNHTSGNHFLNGALTLGGESSGTAAAGVGTYNFSGGNLVAGNVYAGLSGAGTFRHTGGDATYGTLTIGYLPGSTGIYTLAGGTLFNGNQLTVASQGTGTFVQTGGTHTTGGLVIGEMPTSLGTLNVSGGNLDCLTTMVIGSAGSAVVTHSGGSIAAGRIITNVVAGSPDASYHLSGNATLHVYATPDGKGGFFNGIEYLGYRGNFTFTQDGGSHVVDGYLATAVNGGTRVNYTLNAGSLWAAAQSIGYGSGADNTLVQNGGSNTATDFITVGDQPGARGTYQFNAGTITADTFYAAAHGNGLFNHAGGTSNIDDLVVGLSPSGNGTVNLSGGVLNVATSEEIGEFGKGTFNQTGGVHTVAGTVIIGDQSGSTGVYNLRQGTFNAVNVVNNQAFNVFGGAASVTKLSGTSGVTTLTGTNAAASVLNVGSITQKTLAIGNNARVNIVPNPASRLTSSIAALSMGSTTATLDIGNHDVLITGSSTAAINALVRRAAGAPTGPLGQNPWNGIGGITSALVKADAAAGHPGQLAIGVKDNADFVAGGGKAVPAGRVLVSYAAYGDANLDNNVDIADLSIWNNNFGTGDHWGQGDFNYDGVIDIADLSIWNNGFGGSVSPAAPAGAAASSSNSSNNTTHGGKAIASAGAMAAAASLSGDAPAHANATPPAGTMELDIDPATGRAYLNSGGVSLAAIQIDSSTKNMTPGTGAGNNWNSFRLTQGYNLKGWGFAKGTPNTGSLVESTSDATSGSGFPINLPAGTVYDYGAIFPVGFGLNAGDLATIKFQYNYVNDAQAGTTTNVIGVVALTPEPGSITGLLALAGAGLMGRRRRKQRLPGSGALQN